MLKKDFNENKKWDNNDIDRDNKVKMSNQMGLSNYISNIAKRFGIVYSFDNACIYRAKLI